MKLTFFFLFILQTSFLFSGCSLYQSEGRKFLEKQAFQFSQDGPSIDILNQRDNCVETNDITFEFFATDNWKLVSKNFDPTYSVYENSSSKLYSLVVAYTPASQHHLFVCENLYSSEKDLLQRQKEDLQQALETIHSMLH